MVGKLATPPMLEVLHDGRFDDGRFDALVPVTLHRSRLRKSCFKPGGTSGAGRRRKDKRNRIGYTRSRAQHKGPGRTLGGPEKGQRRRRLLSHRTSARQDPTRRRRLYYRSNNERMRSLTRSGRRPRSPRPEPVQDMLAVQHFSTLRLAPSLVSTAAAPPSQPGLAQAEVLTG